MKSIWIKKENRERLIVFCQGWGMDSCSLEKLDLGDHDVLMLYAYHHKGSLPDISKYSHKILLAWSMGVWVATANEDLKNIEWSKRVAINGTPDSIDGKKGIPERIFNRTVEKINSENRKHFEQRILGPDKHSQRQETSLSLRSDDDVCDEMRWWKDQYEPLNHVEKWDRAYVGSKDLIYPVQNQLHAWSEHALETVKIDSSHFPFHFFKSMDQIIA